MHRATPDSPRMFKWDLIDYFSRTHWSVVPILFIPGAALPLIHSYAHAWLGWPITLSLLLSGFAAWTLAEYWLHRTFFHWQPAGAWGERMHFWVHGVHHQWPNDRFRLVMPPAVGLSLYFLCLGAFYTLLGPRLVWGFHAGFVLGYVVYDVTHYYLHHGRPESGYWKRLRRHHLLHHFKDNGSRFAVSNMVWDRVFGTEGTKHPMPRMDSRREHDATRR